MTDLKEAMTVGQVASVLGTTVRTLHHYDNIGLCCPSGRTASGYRLYIAADLMRLHQVAVYRRLEFPLAEIAKMLESGDVTTHLRRQLEVVRARQHELSELAAAIDNALEKTMTQEPMSRDDLRRMFGSGFDEAQVEAEQRWGDQPAWAHSQRRTKSYTATDWAEIKAEADEIQEGMATAHRAGMPATDGRAMELAEHHRQHITRWFYDCSAQMHVELGQMYVADPRFTANYDDAYDAPGLAVWVRDAIAANAGFQGTVSD